MAKTKPNYYKVDEILKCNAQYMIVYGGRSNGKSYAVKHYCAEQAKNPMKKFIYLRRRDMESKTSSVLSYFNDMDVKKIFGQNAKGIMVKSNRIYVEMLDPKSETPKVIDRVHIGYVCNLAGYSHTAGENYNDVDNIIFEEFISRESYLHDEPNTLIDFVSTVARLRDIHVWLLGNTITRFCPYFTEWELKGVLKQVPNSIDLYHINTGRTNSEGNKIVVNIAVERTPEIANDSKMFFGKRAKMITKGEWQSDDKPHLERRIETYLIMYEMVVVSMNFKFYCRYLYDPESQGCFWYVEPKTTEIKPGTRVISDKFNPSPYYTIGLIPVNDDEKAIFREMINQNIVYSDNLCGTEFQQALKLI